MFWKKLFGSPVMPPEVGGRNYLRQKLAEAGRQLPDSCLDEIVRRVLRAIAEVPSIRLEPALDVEVDYVGYAILGDQDPARAAGAARMSQILARHGVIEGSDYLRQLLAARQLPKACVEEILNETLSFFDFVGWETRDQWIEALDIHARWTAVPLIPNRKRLLSLCARFCFGMACLLWSAEQHVLAGVARITPSANP
jgi:hypothetical protein